MQDNELNFFDQEYFKSLESKDKYDVDKTPKTKEKNISAQDLNDPDLNYIDELVFRSNNPNSSNPAENITIENAEDYANGFKELADTDLNDDDSIGSIENFKNPSKIKSKKLSTAIPIIQANNLNENIDPKKLKYLQAKRPTPQEALPPSDHKSIQSTVPNFYKMTKDEVVDILQKNICYFNEEVGLIGIDKPYGLACIGGPGIKICISKLLPLLEKNLKLKEKMLMCHRIDRNTTGTIMFAFNPSIANKVRQYFEERKVIKQYLAITKGVPKLEDGVIDIPLIRREVKGITKTFKTYLSENYSEQTKLVLDRPKSDVDERKAAVTKYRVIDSNKKAALLEIQPETGVKHQIRAHLGYGLACPILGDHKYSHHIENLPQRLPDEILKSLNIRQSKARHVPMHLHAYRIILPEFHQNKNVFITSKLPFHFINTMKKLKLKL